MFKISLSATELPDQAGRGFLILSGNNRPLPLTIAQLDVIFYKGMDKNYIDMTKYSFLWRAVIF
jgi:hypothetical protein